MSSPLKCGNPNEIVIQRISIPDIILASSSSLTIIWRAPYPCQVVAIVERHSVVGGGGATASYAKVAAGVAPGAGVGLQAAVFDLTATVNTEQTATLGSDAICTMAVGDCIARILSGTLTGLVGFVSIVIKRLEGDNG